MRKATTLDDDVAKLLLRTQQQRKISLKEIVNEALRQGLLAMDAPSLQQRRHFETKSVDLGECLLTNLDYIAETLAAVEHETFRP
jgi:hypothetical protein